MTVTSRQPQGQTDIIFFWGQQDQVLVGYGLLILHHVHVCVFYKVIAIFSVAYAQGNCFTARRSAGEYTVLTFPFWHRVLSSSDSCHACYPLLFPFVFLSSNELSILYFSFRFLQELLWLFVSQFVFWGGFICSLFPFYLLSDGPRVGASTAFLRLM